MKGAAASSPWVFSPSNYGLMAEYTCSVLCYIKRYLIINFVTGSQVPPPTASATTTSQVPPLSMSIDELTHSVTIVCPSKIVNSSIVN